MLYINRPLITPTCKIKSVKSRNLFSLLGYLGEFRLKSVLYMNGTLKLKCIIDFKGDGRDG